MHREQYGAIGCNMRKKAPMHFPFRGFCKSALSLPMSTVLRLFLSPYRFDKLPLYRCLGR